MKESKEYLFRFNGTRWYCTNHPTAMTPADLADVFGFVIPEYTQFLRIIDTQQELGFEYRHNGGSIRINIYKL